MLKDRFLHKNEDDVFEENFTDDEESDDEADEVGEKKSNDDNDDDKEQERIAKHFAKRARRNRILEEYEGHDEFSRSRLIDEDETTQKDLKMMKVRTCYDRILLCPRGCTLMYNVLVIILLLFVHRLRSFVNVAWKEAILTPRKRITALPPKSPNALLTRTLTQSSLYRAL